LNKQDLLNLQEKQKKAKEKISNLKGQEENILKQLKDEWHCQDEKETENQIEKYNTDEKQLREDYNNKAGELENWLEEQGIDMENL